MLKTTIVCIGACKVQRPKMLGPRYSARRWTKKLSMLRIGASLTSLRGVSSTSTSGFAPGISMETALTAVVGMPLHDGDGAIELLGQHDADQPVRQGHAAERKLKMGGLF